MGSFCLFVLVKSNSFSLISSDVTAIFKIPYWYKHFGNFCQIRKNKYPQNVAILAIRKNKYPQNFIKKAKFNLNFSSIKTFFHR